VSLKIKPGPSRSLPLIAAGTALVLVTYVTPMATLPGTAADLGADATARAWLLSSMPVGLAAGLLAAGVLGDNFGRRRAYVAGLAMLAAGAFGSAAASDPAVFVGARVLEGLGGAAILACGLAILANDFPEARRRGHATAVWGASVGLGISLGVVLSAGLGTSRWRESYLAVGALALILLWPSVSRIADSRAANRRRLDVGGLVLFATAMTLTVCALTRGRDGIDVVTSILATAAVLALAGFVVVERRTRDPLIELELLRHRGFRVAAIGSMAVGAGITAMASFLPTVVQVGLGAGLWTVAVLVIAWSGTSVATSVLLSRIRRSLAGSVSIAVLLTVVAFGQLLGYGMSAQSSPWRLVPSMVIAGVATGLLNALLGREAVASVGPDRAAMGSGANNTARYLGGAAGVALAFALSQGGGASEFTHGWNRAAVVSAGLCLVGALIAALCRTPRRAQED
jgi:predicted MFS family arabinose efflux permease